MLKRNLKIIISLMFGLVIGFGFTSQNTKAETVNEYIQRNNIQPSNIQQVNGTFDQMFGYENGVGKPEGVVIHETATKNATAWDEVTYFNREWRTAQTYVHAFADANHILQIHNTDYGVWGAGYWANQRFIQIELCEENTYDGFARSVNNQAYFTAYMLKKYGLRPSLADHTGSGTIWSHNAVNQYHPSAGGHTDPIGWFSQWGYSMDQFYQLVQSQYDKLNDTANNAAAGNSKDGIIQVNSDQTYSNLYTRNSDGTFTKSDARVIPANTKWVYNKSAVDKGITYYKVDPTEWAISTQTTILRYSTH